MSVPRNYQVKDAVVIRDGKQDDLKIREFFVKALEIRNKPFWEENL